MHCIECKNYLPLQYINPAALHADVSVMMGQLVDASSYSEELYRVSSLKHGELCQANLKIFSNYSKSVGPLMEARRLG